jgi:hypothetical protein
MHAHHVAGKNVLHLSPLLLRSLVLLLLLAGGTRSGSRVVRLLQLSEAPPHWKVLLG